VDKSPKPEHVGWRLRFTLDVGLIQKNTFPDLWNDSGKLIHKLPTEKRYLSNLLYFDETKNYPPYMGVTQSS